MNDLKSSFLIEKKKQQNNKITKIVTDEMRIVIEKCFLRWE